MGNKLVLLSHWCSFKHGVYFFFFPEHRSKFEPERKEPEVYTPLTLGPVGKNQQQQQQQQQLQQQQQKQLPLRSMPHPRSQFPPSCGPSIPSAITTHLPDSTTESWNTYYSNHAEKKSSILKRRCRDYDGKRSFILA